MCDLHRSDPEHAQHQPAISDLIDELVVCLTNSRIYSPAHPRVKISRERLLRSLQTQLARPDGRPLQITCVDGYLFFDGAPLVGASLSAPRIVEQLTRLKSGGLAFARECSEDDLQALVDVLLLRHLENPAQANMELDQRGCRAIRFLPEFRASASSVGSGDSTDIAAEVMGGCEPGQVPTHDLTLAVPKELYGGLVELLQEVMIKVTRRDQLDLNQARGFLEAVLRLLQQDAWSMMNVSRYEQYDAYTFGHSIRVCFLALYFARTLTQDEALLHRIGLAALLHDIGKAWVPFEILHSRGLLDAEERAEMEKHVLHGAEILLGMREPDPMAVATAFGHHRTLDHRGYPRLKHPTSLSLVTRIVKICDVYEALTAVRPYKPSMSPTRAYRIMMSMSGHFEPWYLRQFISVNGIYSVGSRVRLSSGETARVQTQTATLDAPVVVMELSPEGEPLPGEEERRTLDLSREEGPAARRVQEALLQSTIW